jgi:hypothetical protein
MFIFVHVSSKKGMLSTNHAIDSALKGIIGGAAMGGVVGLFIGFRRPNTPTRILHPVEAPAVTERSAVHVLQGARNVHANSNLNQFLGRLLMYNKFGPSHLRTIIVEMDKAQGIANQVASENKGSFTACGDLSTHQSNAIEAIRLLRSALTSSDGGSTAQVVSAFDDIAAGIQTVCNDNSHNVTMIVQSSMLG